MSLFRSPRISEKQTGGFASIVIAVVMLVVLSLITLGFAELSRHEQTRALDNQLSSQAFYAAETGVNDAIQALKNGAQVSDFQSSRCGGVPSHSGTLGPGVSYSCITVTSSGGAGGTLQKPLGGTSHSWVTALNPSGQMTALQFSWTPTNTVSGGVNGITTCPTLNSNYSTWNTSCLYPMLRFDLVQIPNGATLTRSALNGDVMTAFLRPGAGSSSTDFGTTAPNTGKATSLTANCTASQCSLKITSLNSDANSYYVRAMQIYGSASTTLTLTASNSGGTVGLGGQLIIDATGKAQDVLRRIQVRVGTSGTATTPTYPDYALQTTDSICKRFTYTSGQPLAIAPDIDSSIQAGADGNPLCL
ncbi:MAG TPA: hypothetical protein VG992_01185 [Candidatus Saccharimonadales bacterium]|nr:hypothetical protein [Candidatus Saccharimonadales bacterium]